MVCGRGATGHLGQGTFDIQFSGDVPFWEFAYSFGFFAYPLPFEMRPIGCKFYTQYNLFLLPFSMQWPGSKLKTLLLWKQWV